MSAPKTYMKFNPKAGNSKTFQQKYGIMKKLIVKSECQVFLHSNYEDTELFGFSERVSKLHCDI